MSEQLKYRGRLAEKEMGAKKLKLHLEGLRKSLRDLLDLFEPVEDLEGGIIAAQGLEMAKDQATYKATLGEIKAIEKVLGRG